MNQTYVVAVCTAKRPLMLQDCLNSIADLSPIPDATISVVVVENDTSDNCRTVCEDVAKERGLAVHYSLEPRRGIPFARNRVVEESLAHGADWIAFIDDDETARPDWLFLLAKGCADFGAEAANGPVARTYEKEAPYWWKKQQLRKLETGHEITEAPTNNNLIATRLVAEDGLGLRFAEELTNGAEDIDFFRRVTQAGVKMIWVDEAVVDEFIPASRVETSRLLNRVVMAACSGTQRKMLREGTGVALSSDLPRALRRILVGGLAAIVGLPVRLVGGEAGGKLLWYGITRVLKGYGNLKGLAGSVHDYYGKVDGR
ncbi:glycosyltransferase family 2 protein [Rhizobiaceae bacterium]|nr:glycosyltransferase family 2 protein [Rhizobiaceae bacterium]